MSWDKNTISFSNLNIIKEVLDDFEIPYDITIMETVKGRGLNDEYYSDEPKSYNLRRLQYDKFVVLEHIEQDAGCDVDDVIRSSKFNLDQEPKDWQYVVKTDVNGDYT